MFSADRDTEDEVVTFDDVRPSSENWAASWLVLHRGVGKRS